MWEHELAVRNMTKNTKRRETDNYIGAREGVEIHYSRHLQKAGCTETTGRPRRGNAQCRFFGASRRARQGRQERERDRGHKAATNTKTYSVGSLVRVMSSATWGLEARTLVGCGVTSSRSITTTRNGLPNFNVQKRVRGSDASSQSSPVVACSQRATSSTCLVRFHRVRRELADLH